MTKRASNARNVFPPLLSQSDLDNQQRSRFSRALASIWAYARKAIKEN